MQTLPLADDLFPGLLDGSKQVTVRAGKRDIFPGPLRFRSATGQTPAVVVKVVEVSWKPLSSVTEEEARLDGEETAAALHEALRRFYPALCDTDWVTVIRYEAPIG